MKDNRASEEGFDSIFGTIVGSGLWSLIVCIERRYETPIEQSVIEISTSQGDYVPFVDRRICWQIKKVVEVWQSQPIRERLLPRKGEKIP